MIMTDTQIQRINDRLNSQCNTLADALCEWGIDGSSEWIFFTKNYDAANNNFEAIFDSGDGTAITILFDDILVDPDNVVKFRFVVDNIKANNAAMNIVNMRRHGFSDYANSVVLHNITDERKFYLHYRHYGKVLDYGYIADIDSERRTLHEAFNSVMRVGQRRQEKTGIRNDEKVAQSLFQQQVSECTSIIQLVDSGLERVNKLFENDMEWFKPFETNYSVNDVKLYINPYTNSKVVTMPVKVTIYTNRDKFMTEDQPEGRYFFTYIRYVVKFDIDTNDCSIVESKWHYQQPYYFETPTMQLPSAAKGAVKLRGDLTNDVKYLSEREDCSYEDVVENVTKLISNMKQIQKVVDAVNAFYKA